MTITDDTPAARIVLIGILQVDEEVELRCVREPWGWRPDIVVNHRTEAVSNPPECFKLNDEAIAELNAAMAQAMTLGFGDAL